MSQKRSLTGFLVASLGLAAGLAVMASPDLASADDCAKYKKEAVKTACGKGGKSAVDKAMKDAVKAAKEAGNKEIACKTCHEENEEKTLKSSASADFDKHLAKFFK